MNFNNKIKTTLSEDLNIYNFSNFLKGLPIMFFENVFGCCFGIYLFEIYFEFICLNICCGDED